MPAFIDMTGQRHARLVVLYRGPNAKDHKAQWFCQCACGKITCVIGRNLTKGNTRSCGCLRADPGVIHGHRRIGKTTPEYYSWRNAKNRVMNPRNPHFHNYGGRGITFCPRWMKFENFLEDMGNKPTRLHSIERIENNKGYEPDNCIWATNTQQSANRRTSHLIYVDGSYMCLKEACKHLHARYHSVRRYVALGVPVHIALPGASMIKHCEYAEYAKYAQYVTPLLQLAAQSVPEARS